MSKITKLISFLIIPLPFLQPILHYAREAVTRFCVSYGSLNSISQYILCYNELHWLNMYTIPMFQYYDLFEYLWKNYRKIMKRFLLLVFNWKRLWFGEKVKLKNLHCCNLDKFFFSHKQIVRLCNWIVI